MARLALNKSTLTKLAARLKSYRQFLPSLDLKRRQLMQERAKARLALMATDQKIAEIEPDVRKNLPMLADKRTDLLDLARVTKAEWSEENVVGTRLPVLGEVEVEVRDYSFLAKPHWVDRLAKLLADNLRLQLQRQVERKRLDLLEQAVRTMTQRVNLFEKVLIPRTQANIRRIRLFLGDAERAAVVRAKLAKKKKRDLV